MTVIMLKSSRIAYAHAVREGFPKMAVMLSSVIVVNCRLQRQNIRCPAQGCLVFCFAFMLRRYEDLQISLRQHVGARVNGINVIYVFLISGVTTQSSSQPQ